MKAIKLLLVFSFVVSSSAFADSYNMLSLGLLTTTRGESNNGKVEISGLGTSSIDIEMEFETGLSIGFEHRKIQPHSWGWALGAEYNSKRELDKMKMKGPGGSATVEFIGSDKPSIQTNIIYLNAIYQWEQFYIPFGINYAIHNDKNFDEGTDSSEINGGIGFNFALGVQLSKQHFIELDIKATRMEFEQDGQVDDNGTLYNSTLKFDIYIPFTALRYKYAF